MKTRSVHAGLLLLAMTPSLWAVDQEFYRLFRHDFDPNEPPIAIKSPQLIDTNNLAPKLTNIAINLSNSLARESLAESGWE